MQMLARDPAAAYRRVALEARIEASGGADLTKLCLEEALAALGHVLVALDRSLTPPSEPLTRAQTILLWLAQSVAPEHPLRASLVAFYGGLANQIGANVPHADAREIARIRADIGDLLQAAG